MNPNSDPTQFIQPRSSKRNYVHLSDLHFGRHDDEVIKALHYFLEAQKSQINHILITGDFTQRARVSQFKKAARFIQELGLPVVAIPGNHDIPLFNLLRRWLKSYGRYDRLLSPHVCEAFEDDETIILGLRTTNKWTVKNGRFKTRDAEIVAARFAKAKDKIKILLCHHPLFDTSTEDGSGVEGDQVGLRDRILDADPDLILSGHGHASSVKLLADKKSGNPTVLISAGTVFSTRTRTESNAFNWIGFENGKGHVETIMFDEKQSQFIKTQNYDFKL